MFYRKIIVSLFFLALFINSHAQKYSVSVSGGFQKYVDPKNMDGSFAGGNTGGRALTTEAGYEGFIEGYKKLKLSVLVDYFSGRISQGNQGGNVAGRRYEFECGRVGLGISPYSFEVAKNLIVRPAVEFSVMAINGGTLYTSYRTDSLMVSFIYNEKATTIPRDIYNVFTAAGTLSLAYKIPFGDRWYIAPSYRYYHGLFYEFKDDKFPLVSRRNQLGIIVGWR